MKKIAIALMCTILATGAAMAQKQFTFGPKIGVDYTHYWGEDVNHGGQLNYQAGLFMEYRFTNKFSIAPPTSSLLLPRLYLLHKVVSMTLNVTY